MTAAEKRRSTLERFVSSHSVPEATPGNQAVERVRAFAIPAAGRASAYTVLRIDTPSGITGYGECKPLTGADVRALQILVGKPAYAYDALTPIVPEQARGGVNMALLDIVGKMTNAPVYRVMGGPTRFRARAIARLSGSTDSDLHADLQRQMGLGIRAFFMPIVAPMARNQGSLFVKLNVERFKAMRAAAPGVDFAVEARDALTPSDAGMLAAALEPLHPLWFDEPCTLTNMDTVRQISDETVVPLGFGRGIQNPGTFQELSREGLVDLVRPDLLTFGISGVCRIAAMAETYYTAVAPQHDAGPIATAAALHAAAVMPNFFALQLPDNHPVPPGLHDGFFELPTAPGLGLTVDTRNWERNQIV